MFLPPTYQSYYYNTEKIANLKDFLQFFCFKCCYRFSYNKAQSKKIIDQYALCTTGYEKQPASINTLTTFRNRVIDYEQK